MTRRPFFLFIAYISFAFIFEVYYESRQVANEEATNKVTYPSYEYSSSDAPVETLFDTVPPFVKMHSSEESPLRPLYDQTQFST